MKQDIQRECTLTDEELLNKVKESVSKLCKTGGESFKMTVPVDFNNDDMIIIELCNRFEKMIK